MHAALEMADILRRHGPAYRARHRGHPSLRQLKVMSAIGTCRTAALGNYVDACDDCRFVRIAYTAVATGIAPSARATPHVRGWRRADLLPVGYFHVVFTLPAEIAAIAWHNKAAVYDLLFKAARRRR